MKQSLALSSKIVLLAIVFLLVAGASSTAQPPAQLPEQARVVVMPVEDEGDSGRILVQPREAVTVRINAPADLSAARPLRITAPNGGSINRQRGALVSHNPALLQNVTFSVGSTRGRYTLEIEHRGRTRLLEFWVGQESPLGRAGPPRTFGPPQSNEIR
jgi:hypothetical protein